MTIIKATKRLIDSVWTVEFEDLGNNQARIIRYSRNDEEGYEKEGKLPYGTVIEDEGRTVTGVRIDSHHWSDDKNKTVKTYTVVNPDHVFSYGA